MKNILLVEDNDTIIMGLKYSLEQENFKVISAQNVSEFNGKIDKNDIDLVLLDVSLPDGNGFEICKEIIFTSLEYKILLMLFSNQNKLISREQLLEKIWDIAGNFVNDNTLTVYIKRIREKLGDETIIKTVRGLGYRIGE